MPPAPPDASLAIESGQAKKVLVSASQISLFIDCERKWAFRYLDKIETPPHPSAELGKQVDDEQLQPYLRDGRPLDYTLKFQGERRSADIAAAGLHLLPKTNIQEIQKHITFDTPDGTFGYQGYIDLWLPQGGLPGSSDDGTPCITDFKTTGNLRYRKSAAQLAIDIQANVYARWSFATSHLGVLDLGWIYFHTKKPYRAETTHLRMLRAENTERFEAIDEVAHRLVSIRKASPKAEELKPSVHACGSFGGCPYQHLCNLSPTQKTDAGFATWLKQVETTEMNATTNAGEKLVGLAALRARVAAEKEASTGFVIDSLAKGETYQSQAMVGINPPESLLPPAPAVGSADTAEKASEPVQQPEAPPKRGPGRPKKDPNAAPVQLPLPFPEVVTVTWAEETLTPVPYNTFKVGPFTLEGAVRDGETSAEASARLYAEITAVAEKARDAKAVSFRSALTAYGVVSK